jgi:hypothetical protein
MRAIGAAESGRLAKEHAVTADCWACRAGFVDDVEVWEEEGACAAACGHPECARVERAWAVWSAGWTVSHGVGDAEDDEAPV